MKTIGSYIKEALITKSNIENARKANRGNGQKIVFIPYLTTCSTSQYIKHKEEFSSYDEAVEYFNKKKSNYFTDANPDEFSVVGLTTSSSMASSSTKKMLIPKEQQKDWKSFYQLDVSIKTKLSKSIYSIFVGWTNCSESEMQEI